jgi:hypothetical protein
MLAHDPEHRPTVQELLDNKILQVEYTEDGVPIFKDFNRPKSSPPKHHTQIFAMESKKSVLIKVTPIPEEKEDAQQKRSTT